MNKNKKEFFALLLLCIFLSFAGVLVGCSKNNLDPSTYSGDNSSMPPSDERVPRNSAPNGMAPPDGIMPTDGRMPPENMTDRMQSSIDACVDKSEGDACTFTDYDYNDATVGVTGKCSLMRKPMPDTETSSTSLLCIPDRME